MGVDPRLFSRQAPAAGPTAQMLDGFGGGNRHGHDVLRGLDERNVEQGRQAAASSYFGAGPGTVFRQVLVRFDPEPFEVHPPDRLLLLLAGKVEKEDAVKAFGSTEFWRQSPDVVRRADDEYIRLVVVQP